MFIKNVFFFHCAKKEQTPVRVYISISKTFPKIWCKNIQPKISYEGPKLMRLHLFLLVIRVHVYFVGMKRYEGVEIKAWGSGDGCNRRWRRGSATYPSRRWRRAMVERVGDACSDARAQVAGRTLPSTHLP